MEGKRSEFEARGIRVAALSYDNVETLANFSERVGIGFPLLADPRIRIIESFGIVNTQVPRDHELYGFAYAGYYLIDAQGRVTAKFFNERNNDRFTSANILIRHFDAQADSPQGEAETKHLKLRWSASNPVGRPGQRLALVLEVDLKERMHVYAPEVQGYIPIDWQMQAPEGADVYSPGYPSSKMMHLPAIDETVPVYQGSFKLLRDIRIGGGRRFPPVLQGKDKLVFEGLFKYQACDDIKCYLPVTVPLTWALQLKDHDLTRVPEEIRRQSPQRQ